MLVWWQLEESAQTQLPSCEMHICVVLGLALE